MLPWSMSFRSMGLVSAEKGRKQLLLVAHAVKEA